MERFDFSDPNYLVRWPADLLVDELNAAWSQARDVDRTNRVLVDAFVGSGVMDLWRQTQGGRNDFFGKPEFSVNELVESVIEAAESGVLRVLVERPPLWRARQNKSLASPQTFSPSLVRKRFKETVADLDKLGYFDRDAGEPCVDDESEPSWTLPEIVERDLDLALDFSFCVRRSNGDGRTGIETLDDDEFYELVEYLHDLVARPRNSHYHRFCGLHYFDFLTSAGQRLYRWRINRLLDQSEACLKLADDGDLVGRLIQTTDDAREDLYARVLVGATGLERGQLSHALGLFRTRDASQHDKRSAVIVLAAVLEDNRSVLKENLLTRDESDLFMVANKFAIRHQRADQQKDYDPVFLDWIFWWYLATIELAQRLIDR